MAKARRTTKKKKAAARGPTVTTLRKEIDRIDRQLVQLINQRAQCAHQIGQLKQVDGSPAYCPEREEAVLARLLSLNKGPLGDRCVRAVFAELISGSRALEQSLRVAFLGPEYTYSHLATMHRFGSSIQFVPVATIGAVFEEVHKAHVDFGIVPLENSTDGRIADTLDMFTRLPVRFCGEVKLWIHHALLGCSPRSKIRRVYSRPQALSQCRNWLAEHLPGAETVEVTSTATAAQYARDEEGAAAIASAKAAAHYSVQILAENIEDQRANLTRFAVIGHDSAARTGDDRTAVMYEVAHEPGTLADSMAVFKRNRLNLTWIESFPMDRPEGGYLFFVELDGHESDLRVRRAYASLEKKTIQFRVLGSYPKSAPVG